jgi:hypothetical protein
VTTVGYTVRPTDKDPDMNKSIDCY